MDRGNLSRRGFLQRTTAALAAAGLPLWMANEIAQARLADDTKKPGDPINVGLIGCGGQGRGILNWALKDKGVRVVAVCDVDEGRLKKASSELGGAGKVTAYADFRELNDHKGLDAVLIGTPDHWHTLCAIDAMNKKKDVYCEKPLTLTVAEGVALTKVAKETGRIFQVGSQQRSDARFRLACELVRNGRLGKIKRVETRIGDNPKGGPFKVEPVPEGLNWDMWQGQVKKTDYIKQRCHYEFRWWYEYSGGKMTDWGAHHNDTAQWALGMDEAGPVSVSSRGDKPADDGKSYNCHPHFEVAYGYESGAQLVCMSKGENGVRFEGEDGKWLFVSRSLITASDQAEKPVGGKKPKKGGPSKILDEPLGKDAVRLYKSDNHMANWLDGIRNRKPCICTAEVGHRSVTVCHIGVISLRLGGKALKWDAAKQRFDDDEANRMLSREMHNGWKVPA
ncbi:MAG: Gfo/Idh/MocA family oxidoreductase [Gemmataceae bacterium]|nr:Gfo/Idh/MocA family oxidoreductase [Gemmataceae bacterium]